MVLSPHANYNGIIKQVGRLTGPGEIVNGSSFARDDEKLVSVGMGNRAILFVSFLFQDYSIFSDPNFSFMGLQIGWTLTQKDGTTSKRSSARRFEFNSQVVSPLSPFAPGLYIEPKITLSANPDFGDTQMAKMNWMQFEFPYDNPNQAPGGPPTGYGVHGLALPLIAMGDYMAAWIRLKADPSWTGFSPDDDIQLDIAVGSNAM